MDVEKVLQLLILSMEKFGSVSTLVMFALVGIFFYLLKTKSKTEKVLSQTLEHMNKNNADSVKMTAENISEIRDMTTDVLKSMHTLNGEIRGIIDILKFLMGGGDGSRLNIQISETKSKKENEDGEDL